MPANRASGSRLRRIEAWLQSSRVATSSPAQISAVVLACFRDYFAGVGVDSIAEKMRRSGVSDELVRYYTEGIFTQAKAELTDWEEQMAVQSLSVPTGLLREVPAS